MSLNTTNAGPKVSNALILILASLIVDPEILKSFLKNFTVEDVFPTWFNPVVWKSIDEKSEANCNPGSHIDIAPTLIELVAPSNFTYYSFGNSLLNNNRKNKLGIGYNKVINSNQISEFSKNYGIKKQSINSCKQKNDLLFKENKREHDSLMSLAWLYVTNGDRLD